MNNFIVTGANGQLGQFLIKYLQDNEPDLNIIGTVRHKSYDKQSYIFNRQKVILELMELSDVHCIESLICKYKPRYFVNTAANAFVGESWKVPVQQIELNTLGVLHQLEAIRKHSPHTRFFNMGTSEEFGNDVNDGLLQNEKTLINPKSPYGCAKAAARYLVNTYRNSYNLYALQGWTFNFECLTEKTPILLKNKNSNLIDIKPIEEIVPHRTSSEKGKRYITTGKCDWLIWNGNNWTEIKTRTANWNDEKNDKKVIRVMCRGGYYEATSSHKSFKKGEIETPTEELKKGDELELKELPELSQKSCLSLEEAEFLGLMTAEGHVCKKNNTARFTNKDVSLCERAKELWSKISCGFSSDYYSKSGFTGEKDIKNINFYGDSHYCSYLRKQLYTEMGEKRVPQRILNSSSDIILTYLKAYNSGDGLKAGHQKTEFKSFGTVSQTLAAGLWYLLNKQGFRVILCPTEKEDGSVYYVININSDNNPHAFGKHLVKNINEITNLSPIKYKGWLFDIETESHTYSAGIGFTWVHNSELRGEKYVTKKITQGVARIYHSIKNNRNFEPIELGNLDSHRSWQFCGDVADGIWRMLNQDKYNSQIREKLKNGEKLESLIKNYVMSADSCHTVREFVETAFTSANITFQRWKKINNIEKLYLSDYISASNFINYAASPLVQINPEYLRPHDVSYLNGDASLIKNELEWKSSLTFQQLVDRMVSYDILNYHEYN